MDHNKTAVAVFDKLASLYQDRFMDVSLYHDSLDLFCKEMPQNAALLELACGPGNITKYLLEKRLDLKIMGTDLAPQMIELAKVNNPTAHFELLDLRKIAQLDKRFHGLVCGFGLPYLSKDEAIQFIADTDRLLHPEGLLYLSTMEDDNDQSRWQKGSTGDEIFTYYHEAAYLTEALEKNGFRLRETFRKKYLHNEQNTTDLIIIAKK